MEAISVSNLDFAYFDKNEKQEKRVVFEQFNLKVPAFSRCLLLGANGVGKSTLIRILAGKHLVSQGKVEVFGQSPFSGNLGLHDIQLVGERFPLELDISVQELLDARKSRNREREEELLDLLEVETSWRMHRVSNGQRRRVDLLLSLCEKTPKLLLLDEVTSDLDILSRQNLLRWLKQETDQKKMTVVFATHILDGMQQWATQIAFLSSGKLRCMASLDSLPGYEEACRQNPHAPLLWLCEKWLREDYAKRQTDQRNSRRGALG